MGGESGCERNCPNSGFLWFELADQPRRFADISASVKPAR
jgi:hypothetical protein